MTSTMLEEREIVFYLDSPTKVGGEHWTSMFKDGREFREKTLNLAVVIYEMLRFKANQQDLRDPAWDWSLSPDGVTIAISVIEAVRNRQVFPTSSLYAVLDLVQIGEQGEMTYHSFHDSHTS